MGKKEKKTREKKFFFRFYFFVRENWESQVRSKILFRYRESLGFLSIITKISNVKWNNDIKSKFNRLFWIVLKLLIKFYTKGIKSFVFHGQHSRLSHLELSAQ